MRALVFSALVLGAAAPHCLACVYMTAMPANQMIHAGPSFGVRVEDHRGRPVRGLSIAAGSDHVKSQAITDADGFASFRDLGPGIYSLSAEQDVSWTTGKVLEVQSDGPGGIIVPVTWPAVTPIAVRSLKGTLHVPNYVPGQPGPELKLSLLIGVSGQRLASVQTNINGDFDFGITTPGIYFLNIGPFTSHPDGNPIGGSIAVSVGPDAPSDRLEVELGSTDCGLTYVDLTPCPLAELHVGQLRGRVIGPAGAVIVKGGDLLNHTAVPTDPAGPAVPGAEILLVDPGGGLIERLSTDRSGEFASKQALTGRSDLLVRSFGFVTFRAQVFIAPDASSSAALNIRLGNVGSCSSARVQ